MGRRLLTGAVALAIFGLGPAVPPRAAPQAAAPGSEPSAEVERLKAAFERLPEPDRRAIQDALVWTGNFAGLVSGTFGPRTRDALAAFAKRSGVPLASVLDPEPRGRLLALAKAARDGLGFSLVRDAPAGLTLGLPLKLLTRRTRTETGTRYASADGAFVVDTLSRPAGQGGLAEAFDRLSTETAGRKVTYKLLKPDFFVVSGETGDRKFYSRFASGPPNGAAILRGVTLTYPKSDAARLDPSMLATAASFDPFPAGEPAVKEGPGPSPQAGAGHPPSAAPTPAPASATVTGIRIASGLIVTALPGDGCPSPSTAGAALHLRMEDPSSGLALLEDLPATADRPILTQDPVPPGARLTALFLGEAGKLAMAPAEVVPIADPRAGALSVSTSIQGRAEGVPLLDRAGNLAGIVRAGRKSAPVVAGTVLTDDYAAVTAGGIGRLVERAGVAQDVTRPAPAATPAEVAARWRPLVLTILCSAKAPSP